MNRPLSNTSEQSESSTNVEMFSLTGRAAIVTGASSGLGVQIGTALRQAGAKVMLVARREHLLASIASELDCNFHVADITSSQDRSDLIDHAIELFGSIDVLVNNAGVASTGPAQDENVDSFRMVLETNLVAPFDLARLAGIHMLQRGSGSIINIASTLGMLGNISIPDAAYAASKGGLVVLTRELAAQWARRGIRVNAIAPGYFETEMTASMFDNERSLKWIARHDPMGRPGKQGEIGGAAIYLASDASSYVTGHVLVVDGGWSAV